MSWKAIYTKSRNEKKVADKLRQLGFEVYCPLQTVVRQWSDRKKKVSVPVFSSYVFLKCEEQRQIDVLQVSGVVNFVRYDKKIASIPNHEIELVETFLADNKNVKIEAFPSFGMGELVKVEAGGLKGVEGQIQKIKGSKASLILNEMGIQLVAEIQLAKLQKI